MLMRTMAENMPDRQFTELRFEQLDLVPSLMQGVRDAGFEYCTPIQARALPIALAGGDVQGQAQTGTGKSAAFLLAAMQRLLTREPTPQRRTVDPRVLILAPTRELAVQIHKDAEVLGQHTGLSLGVVFGGTGYDSQREMLRDGLDVLIGTPGRLIDYFKQRIFDLRAVEVAIVDEADRMFDLGFIRDLRYLMRRLPPPTERLNLLFSATLSWRVKELAYEHMNAPEVIDVSPPDRRTVQKVTQTMYHTSSDEKIPLLLGLLGRAGTTRTIVFVNTKREAERIDAYLEGNGLRAAMLNGDVPQNKRLSLLEKFKTGALPILIATDVASRGLHIPDVTHVINYDLPQDPQDYVHRVGRTARAGASGAAVSFSCERYCYSLVDIQDYLGHEIPVSPHDPALLVTPAPPARRAPRRPRFGGPRRDGDGGRGSRGGGRGRGGRPRGGSGSGGSRS